MGKIDQTKLIELAQIRKADGRPLSHKEIAEEFKVSRVAVTKALKKLPPTILEARSVERYREKRADIIADLQRTMMNYMVDPAKLKRASLSQLITAFGILYDKERLERGQATAHIATVSIKEIDPETLKHIQAAVKAQTKAALKPTLVEPSGSGDSDAASVDVVDEERQTT